MEDKYFKILPSEIGEIVSEVEGAIGGEIKIQSRVPNGLADDFDWCGFQYIFFQFKRGKWEISINHQDRDLSARTLTHECLHAKRNFLDKVPHLFGARGGRKALGASLESQDANLDHISIVPIDHLFFPEETRLYWERDIGEALDYYKFWPKAHKNRNYFFTIFALANLALESCQLADYATEVARKLNMEADANRFLVKIKQFRENKTLQIGELLKVLNIPKRKYAVEYYDEKLGFVPLSSAALSRYPSIRRRVTTVRG